ncbi:DUF5753 domain-containing protein [Kitasatospora sp. NPDC098652]|uniref:DUF5753 domain-containing protein n=1 Tax=Kitasatospora sp. NPDC098652 TaxID=3364095 RepID=UPI0038059227
MVDAAEDAEALPAGPHEKRARRPPPMRRPPPQGSAGHVLTPVAASEHHSTAMRIASVIHIPGLLQTVDQVRALGSNAVPPLAPHEVEHRVSYRIKRQVVIYGERAIPLTAIVHEAALRMGFGGPAVARAQLKHLIEVSTRENVSVLVIPFGAGTLPGSGQSIVYCSAVVPQLDTVQLDTYHGSEFLDATHNW